MCENLDLQTILEILGPVSIALEVVSPKTAVATVATRGIIPVAGRRVCPGLGVDVCLGFCPDVCPVWALTKL